MFRLWGLVSECQGVSVTKQANPWNIPRGEVGEEGGKEWIDVGQGQQIGYC